LHHNGLLSEHEHWPHEGATSYEDNTFNVRGAVTFTTPPLVERTVVVGPATLTLYVSTTADEVLLFASLWVVNATDERRILTRGWLRGTLSAVNAARSSPWQYHHDFTVATPVTPDTPQRYDLNLIPTAYVFKPGDRLQVQISSADVDEAGTFLDFVAQGHLLRQRPSWVSVHHDADHASVLSLPVITGNRIGTYLSGGNVHSRPGHGTAAGHDTNWEAW
jgi:hypothetical protein